VSFVFDTAASTASCPNVRDDWPKRPSFREQDGRENEVIWALRQAEYFLREDWTPQIRLKLLNNLDFARRRDRGLAEFQVSQSVKNLAVVPA
jgi:hypothetical protein